jgi:hypothetical protein
MVRETLKPGETVHHSGIYQGSKSGERTTLVEGNLAPLTPMRHESWIEVAPTNPPRKQ